MGAATLLFQEMIMLYGIAFIGYIARKYQILPEASDYVLTQLVLYITLPALILYSMDFPYDPAYLHDFSWLIGLSCIAIILACGIGMFLRKRADLPEKQKGVYEGLIVFGNQGFIGYAIIYILLGNTGILYTAVFNFLYILLIWTYGIYVVGRTNASFSWKWLAFNPGVISTIVGFVVFMLPFQWPKSFHNLFETVGLPTIPLSMLIIGILLANLSASEVSAFLHSKYLWLSIFTRLLFIPLCLVPLIAIPIKESLLIVVVLVAATPSAPTIALYARKYGGDPYFASIGSSVSTVLSMVTITLLYGLLKLLGS
ncbi:AEC family transporter [Alkalihalobacillus sp. AL-G]|uniref:AEC family transporter n=1 Tax=Alkalihalobacillus sp. AL-G TaxID=2926399 RepID=UPI00272C8314|nr:AEC family transporter [Alkalihalobacillus sp. AL-G]WLD94220.1 AEC family transporter [Alkalihalobacillus sp. AL-G]